jgi:DnaJ-class molecular chaperone
MRHIYYYSEICPICKGRGYVEEYNSECTSPKTTKTCYGCGGKGWITVREIIEGYCECHWCHKHSRRCIE